MKLPDSYLMTPNRVSAYFDAMKNAEAPDRFSHKFLENLGFSNTNDRMLTGVLKDLGFIDTDGVPLTRYYEFLDRSISAKVIAEGIRDAFSDLFAVNKNANELSAKEVENKLRTMYAGSKTDLVISRIAKTFEALCTIADFSKKPVVARGHEAVDLEGPSVEKHKQVGDEPSKSQLNFSKALPSQGQNDGSAQSQRLSVKSLQYHINIVLPDSRDQAVYDAIFKSMREHLG